MMRLIWLVAPLALAGCPKKDKAPAGPIEGWYQAPEWKVACYHPYNWEALSHGERRSRRQDAYEALSEQWTGGRADGVAMDPGAVETVQTILLGYPEKVEKVVLDNLAQCKAYAQGGALAPWQKWLFSQTRALMVGECARPLDRTMYDYLNIDVGWQFKANICADNVVRISASSGDYYRLDPKGPWINAEGDKSTPATGTEYPCTLEDCYAGTLIVRFRGESGTELIRAVGTELIFQPPEHGTIELMINDSSLSDNVFKVERGVQHRTSLTYTPVK